MQRQNRSQSPFAQTNKTIRIEYFCDLKNGYYQGQQCQYKKDGIGIFIHDDSSIYIGGWKQDKLHGAGLLFYPNNAGYILAEFERDKLQGPGILRYGNDFIAGHWKDSKLHGKVYHYNGNTQTWLYYHYYEGRKIKLMQDESNKSVEDLPDFVLTDTQIVEKIENIFTWSFPFTQENCCIKVVRSQNKPKTIYIGFASALDEPEGLGITIEDDKFVTMSGIFKNGKLHGLGRMCYENFDIFDGFFRCGMMEGQGIFYQKKQDVYILGEFKQNKCFNLQQEGKQQPQLLIRKFRMKVHEASLSYFSKLVSFKQIEMDPDEVILKIIDSQQQLNFSYQITNQNSKTESHFNNNFNHNRNNSNSYFLNGTQNNNNNSQNSFQFSPQKKNSSQDNNANLSQSDSYIHSNRDGQSQYAMPRNLNSYYQHYFPQEQVYNTRNNRMNTFKELKQQQQKMDNYQYNIALNNYKIPEEHQNNQENIKQQLFYTPNKQQQPQQQYQYNFQKYLKTSPDEINNFNNQDNYINQTNQANQMFQVKDLLNNKVSNSAIFTNQNVAKNKINVQNENDSFSPLKSQQSFNNQPILLNQSQQTAQFHQSSNLNQSLLRSKSQNMKSNIINSKVFTIDESFNTPEKISYESPNKSMNLSQTTRPKKKIFDQNITNSKIDQIDLVNNSINQSLSKGINKQNSTLIKSSFQN